MSYPPLTLCLDLGGGGFHRRCRVTAMDRSTQCSVSVYVYERNNVKLTDLPTNKHRNVTVKEAKLNRTLHCNSSAHDMTVAAEILD